MRAPLLFVSLLGTLFAAYDVAVADVTLAVPQTPGSKNIVKQSFLGISFELSFMDEYFGNDTSTIPLPMLNHLQGIRRRLGDNPLRLRVGGNSMDTSIYNPNGGSPMVQLSGVNTNNTNNQPADYGPLLWDVLAKVSSNIGGISYLVGLSLMNPDDPSVPIIAADASKKLDSALDAFLLGNEPDLYTGHGHRPNIANYTTAIYIDEYKNVSSKLASTSAGNLLTKGILAGPTICCSWNLDRLLDDGYVSTFNDQLKYVTVQHYPQNNCFGPGKNRYQIPYYAQHSNVVELAAWQNPGINMVTSGKQQLIMSEFNSASCGGLPGMSNTYVVGTMWTIDYALQMASVGYSAAFLHTRERGITYNLFTVPDGPDGSAGAWITNPTYYSLVVLAEALDSQNGVTVSDIDAGGSKGNPNITTAGYSIRDATTNAIRQLVLFNYANVSSSDGAFELLTIPAGSISPPSGKVTVRYLGGENMATEQNIGWGGQTLSGVGDGNFVAANATWAPADDEVECSNGCTIRVPAPGLAVVFAGGAPKLRDRVSPSTSSASVLSPTVTLSSMTFTGSFLPTPSGRSSASGLSHTFLWTSFSVLLFIISPILI
ncbi:glycoside hydrolase family 79 protein [Panaeolus papilionaceus]|nr:glycoside hydrolase family 79 protein [Panaeolus papilionaceus]